METQPHMPQKNLFTEQLLNSKAQRTKCALAIMAVAQYGNALDEMFWTPLRDLQVFGKKAFSAGWGPGHPILNIASVATGMVASLPYLFKVFNENETNTLQGVLQNCETEFGQSFFEPAPTANANQTGQLKKEAQTALENHFKKHLKKEGLFDIEPVIVAKTRRKKTYWDVEYS